MRNRIEEYLKTLTTTELAAGGLLQPEQAERFLDFTLEYSTLLKEVRAEGKARNKGEVDTLNIGGVCTVPASEPETESIDEKLPDFGKIEFAMVKLRSAFNMSTETLLDNIESDIRVTGLPGKQQGEEPPGDFRETLMRAYAKRIATDIELGAIQGDTAHTGTTMKDKLLKCNNGWLKMAQLPLDSCHIVDAGSKNVSIKLFAAMLEALPAPYLKTPADLRWLVGSRLNIRWTSKLAERQTTLGDDVLKGMGVAPFGIPMMLVPLMPEDKVVGTIGSHGFIMLTYLENLNYVYRRLVEMYWEFRPRKDIWENTTYTETDYMIENKDAMVLATNVKVDATKGYGE